MGSQFFMVFFTKEKLGSFKKEQIFFYDEKLNLWVFKIMDKQLYIKWKKITNSNQIGRYIYIYIFFLDVTHKNNNSSYMMQL